MSRREPTPIEAAQARVVLSAKAFREASASAGLLSGRSMLARDDLFAARDQLADASQAKLCALKAIERGAS